MREKVIEAINETIQINELNSKNAPMIYDILDADDEKIKTFNEKINDLIVKVQGATVSDEDAKNNMISELQKTLAPFEERYNAITQGGRKKKRKRKSRRRKKTKRKRKRKTKRRRKSKRRKSRRRR